MLKKTKPHTFSTLTFGLNKGAHLSQAPLSIAVNYHFKQLKFRYLNSKKKLQVSVPLFEKRIQHRFRHPFRKEPISQTSEQQQSSLLV